MGLDMYLYCNDKRVCEAAWGDMEVEPYKLVSGHAAYWRKANQIHLWFVNNVQDGNDDCGTYEVEVEQLVELLDTVNRVLSSTELVDGKVHNGTTYRAGEVIENWEDGKVLKDATLAQELLPTTSGFFFGGTGYDQWYWEDLEYTRDVLTRILDSIEEVEYQAFNRGGKFTFTDWMFKGETAWEVKFQYHSSW